MMEEAALGGGMRQPWSKEMLMASPYLSET